MRRLFLLTCAIGMVAAACGAPPLLAQPVAPPSIDPSTIPVPDLSFTLNPATLRNLDKYVYFHRDGTDFATAFADIRECDAFAREVGFYIGGSPFTGALTGVAVDAIFGSAERRRIRRANMRVCMRFKEYRIYGLPEAIWERFNFEEGNQRVPEAERERMLRVQARIASGPRPTLGEVSR
ncbi:MAG TPA: hypothetical protein VEW71_02720 [Allosphingosinicella sp.]|nr:hypothetical protein [Allosphingosinicella sp.]